MGFFKERLVLPGDSKVALQVEIGWDGGAQVRQGQRVLAELPLDGRTTRSAALDDGREIDVGPAPMPRTLVVRTRDGKAAAALPSIEVALMPIVVGMLALMHVMPATEGHRIPAALAVSYALSALLCWKRPSAGASLAVIVALADLGLLSRWPTERWSGDFTAYTAVVLMLATRAHAILLATRAAMPKDEATAPA